MANLDAGLSGVAQYTRPTYPQIKPSGTDATIAVVAEKVDRQHEIEVGKLILQHQAGLRSFARYLTRSGDRADDLVQDAIVRALVNAEKFSLGTNFRAWICTIARNLFYSEQGRMRDKHTSIHEMLHEPSTPPTQEESLSFCDFRRAFQQLSASRREALMLVSVDGLSYDAAAFSEGCASGTMKSRVSRGRNELKLLLSQGPISLPRRAVRRGREDKVLAFLAAARSSAPETVLPIIEPRQKPLNDQKVRTLDRWDDDGGASQEYR